MSKIIPVKQDSLIYNAADHPNHLRGKDGKGKKTLTRIYSVWRIDHDVAYCQSRDCLGKIWEEQFHVNTLVPYSKEKN